MILDKNIIDKILAKIPQHLNPVEFLHDILNISKESVYRRLRGDVAFTFEEVINLSSKLSFSLDEIVFSDEDHDLLQRPVAFQFRSNKMFDPQKTITEILSSFIRNQERVKEAKNAEVLVAANQLMVLTSAYYDYLFKFHYYKWIHQTQQMSLNFSFGDVVFSDEINDLRNKLKMYESRGEHTYILDHHFLKNTLKEVQYYYRRKLISEDDVVLLQKDFHSFIDLMEYKVKFKPKTADHTNYIYLSALKIDSNGLYCQTDGKETLDLWISFGTSIRTENPEICKTYKSWFNSLKKYSSLITGCNEILQSNFFDKQRSYVEAITSKDINI